MLTRTHGNLEKASALVSVRGACKRFGKLRAVDDVGLEIRAGEIVGLIGPNGSGKTTLVNLVSGALRMDEGRILLGGLDASSWSSQRRCHWGLARTMQVARPLTGMTVFENVVVGALFGHYRTRSLRSARLAAGRVLDEVGLDDVRDAMPTDLPIERLKLLEMARALASEPNVLLLDETLAGLTHGEAADVLALIKRKRGGGTGILFIEHRLADVLALSDRVYVLNAGALLAEGRPDDVVDDPEVLRAYLGVDLEQPAEDS